MSVAAEVSWAAKRSPLQHSPEKWIRIRENDTNPNWSRTSSSVILSAAELDWFSFTVKIGDSKKYWKGIMALEPTEKSHYISSSRYFGGRVPSLTLHQWSGNFTHSIVMVLNSLVCTSQIWNHPEREIRKDILDSNLEIRWIVSNGCTKWNRLSVYARWQLKFKHTIILDMIGQVHSAYDRPTLLCRNQALRNSQIFSSVRACDIFTSTEDI